MYNTMDRFRLTNTNILVADTMPASSEATKNALYDLGGRNFTITKSVSETREQLDKDNFDVLISGAYLMDEGTASIVTDLRQGKLGQDPFIPVIALTWEPTIEIVQELVSAGIDQMLTLPVSGNKIAQALDTLVERRKPFVVTSQYIGPDRRKDPRPEQQQIPRIEVPNALRFKVTGMDDGISRKDVLQTIRNQRAERYAYRIVYTIGIITGLVSDKNNGTMETWLTDLHDTLAELTRHIADTLYRHHQALCETLLDVARRNLGCDSPGGSDLELMQQLALSVQVGFSPQDTAMVDVAPTTSSEMPVCATA